MKIIKANYGFRVPKDFTGIVKWYDGKKIWYQNGKPHRKDGPAIVSSWVWGERWEWRHNGKKHRLDGPAFYFNGLKKWYQNGRLHRLDGPAIQWEDLTGEYWINGKELTEEQFRTFQWMWKNTQKKKTKKLMKIFVKLIILK